jgi:hypothetical protein
MARFRDIKTLQKFASVHASLFNHFNTDRHLQPARLCSRTARRSGGWCWRRFISVGPGDLALRILSNGA